VVGAIAFLTLFSVWTVTKKNGHPWSNLLPSPKASPLLESALINCESLHEPVRIQKGEPFYLMNLLGSAYGLGLSQAQGDSHDDMYWPPGKTSSFDEMYKCDLTNYGSDSAINVTMTFDVEYRSVLRNGSQIISGTTVLKGVHPIEIPVLDTDPQRRKFTFYIQNTSHLFAFLTTPKSAQVEYVHTGKTMQLPIRKPHNAGDVMILSPRMWIIEDDAAHGNIK
jgi:hypothetical protein